MEDERGVGSGRGRGRDTGYWPENIGGGNSFKKVNMAGSTGGIGLQTSLRYSAIYITEVNLFVVSANIPITPDIS